MKQRGIIRVNQRRQSEPYSCLLSRSISDLHGRTHACAGTNACGHEDGVCKEPLLLHAVAGDVRRRRRPVHRVRAAVHALLAARAAVAPHLARAGPPRGQVDPRRGPRRPRQGTRQRRHPEEGAVVMREQEGVKQSVLVWPAWKADHIMSVFEASTERSYLPMRCVLRMLVESGSNLVVSIVRAVFVAP